MDNQTQQQFHYIITPQPIGADGLVGIAGMRRMDMAALGPQIQQQRPGKGVFGRMKDALLNLVTEEVDDQGKPVTQNGDERPIGLSQLSRNTFQASEHAVNTFFKRGRAVHDYRFAQLFDRQGY